MGKRRSVSWQAHAVVLCEPVLRTNPQTPANSNSTPRVQFSVAKRQAHGPIRCIATRGSAGNTHLLVVLEQQVQHDTTGKW